MADIRDLARHLNISTGTVSRALNNRPGVNAETRQKVLAAAIDLGYRANQSGRSLRRGSTNTIGFVVETGSQADQESGGFFFIVIDEMNLYLADRGYDLVILPCHSADDPVEFLARVVARGTVDAVVITATRRQDQRIDLLSRSTLPFLTLGRSETPADFPWIDLDFEGAAARSVQEFAARGHRHIAVGVPNSEAMLGYHYLRGFRQAMVQADLQVNDDLIFRVNVSESGGFDLGRHIARANPRPTAVMSCSEATTVGLYASLQEAGLIPGADVSVITFRENSQLRFLTPAPACFSVDLKAVGQWLGASVLKLLADDPVQVENLVVPMDFAAGASITKPPRS